MSAKQVSIFLENKKGRLAEVTGLLTREAINIRAISLSDTADYGVLRLIVDDHRRCLKVLKDHDFAAQETEVIPVEIRDEPGSLHHVVELLDREGVSIEYMYGFFEKNDPQAIMVFKIDDLGRAIDILTQHKISILSEDAIEKL